MPSRSSPGRVGPLLAAVILLSGGAAVAARLHFAALVAELRVPDGALVAERTSSVDEAALGAVGVRFDAQTAEQSNERSAEQSHERSAGSTVAEPVRVASLDGAPVSAGGRVDPWAPAERPLGAAPQDDPANAAEVPLPPDPERIEAKLELGALAHETAIREKPSHSARILGYARTGALLRRAGTSAGKSGCPGGWYKVEPRGYVCAGKAATLDLEDPVLAVASTGPDRSLGLPYVYGRSRYPTPPLYTQIPNAEQQAQLEQDLAAHLPKGFGALWAEQARSGAPSPLAGGAPLPQPYGYGKPVHGFARGRALAKSAFAFIDFFEEGGRKYGITTDLALVPLDRVTPVATSEFFGVHLGPEAGLPVAFTRSQNARVYQRTDDGVGYQLVRTAAYREAFYLTGERRRFGGLELAETKSGEYVEVNSRLTLIDSKGKLPKWAKDERSWLDVSILRQTLVAYVGERPVFATLVSTGADGLGDPETTHSTVQGVFLVHTKHVTATMSGDQADDEFDLHDVPYVQYFEGGYALHGAYWHDSFGQPKSHGCINLSPAAARHLFTLTEPKVPERWHSALSRDGTLVYVHP